MSDSEKYKNLANQKDVAETSSASEALSALMDGEASEFELRRILARCAPDAPEAASVRDTWRRYHLVRASLLQETHSKLQVDLLDGIHARLADSGEDKLYPATGRTLGLNFGGVMRRLGQGAVAASVAFTVLYSASHLQGLQGDAPASMTATAQQDANTAPQTFGEFTLPTRLALPVSTDGTPRDKIRRAVLQASGTQLTPLGEPYTFPLELDMEQNTELDQEDTLDQ